MNWTKINEDHEYEDLSLILAVCSKSLTEPKAWGEMEDSKLDFFF